eukprot:GEMP01060962.1.p1 GENE.GEMP01060962.1~~GEMP01060962.1.p1  ORF type:complete len:101 (+),score=10.27 GEMP01060962.1:28-303(+)
MAHFLKRVNWYSFALQRYKVYDVIWKVGCYGVIGTTLYLGANVGLMWNEALNVTWQHYARKERERADLVDLIRQARVRGDLPPPEDYDGFR